MAVGTLTVFPVRGHRVDRETAGWAMLLAPAAGLPLAASAAGVAALVVTAGSSGTLAALLGLGVVALLTRGLHLDGLADLADGLGSARPAEGALEVMRRSDIGPFGVLTLLFVVGLQVAALSQLAVHGAAVLAAVAAVAVTTGRLALTWACRSGVPAARPRGLGALVAGTVPGVHAAGATFAVLAAALLAGGAASGWGFAAVLPAAVVAGLSAAELLRVHAVRRLGGITGDVLGAGCETAVTAALVSAAVLGAVPGVQ